ncbi:MAG: 3'-5' exoribonuclease [Ruminococcus sp.]|nr:3'-5' exoribonuclease [Ruminococcus sp.]
MGLLSRLFGRKAAGEDYVVIDLETTGLSPNKADIIEIGAVKVVGSVIVDRFDKLVKPPKSLPQKTTELTGITMADLENAPSINCVLPELLNFIGDFWLVGHNIIDFDSQFLAVACARLQYPFENKLIDTLEMSRQALPALKDHKLETVCKHFKVKNKKAHRALSDCEATQAIYEKLRSKYKPAPVNVSPPKDIRRFPEAINEKTERLRKLDDLLVGIASKGELTQSDTKKVRAWLKSNPDCIEDYPVYEIAELFKPRAELENAVGRIEACCMPLFQENGAPIDLSNKNIVLTGEFKCGSPAEITLELERQGAKVSKNVTKKTNYLIVGSCLSPDWSFRHYGQKFKYAKELQRQGQDIRVISEIQYINQR